VKGDKNMENSIGRSICSSLKAQYRKGFHAGYSHSQGRIKRKKATKKKYHKTESVKERIEHVENEEFRLLGDVGHLARQILKIKTPLIRAIYRLSNRVSTLEEQIQKLKKGK
jgi:hypothetical protein